MIVRASVLVVANRTAQSDELFETLRERAARGSARFLLLVPAAWEVDDPHGGRQTARRRLNRALARLRDTGLVVEGVLGDRPGARGPTGLGPRALRRDHRVHASGPDLGLAEAGPAPSGGAAHRPAGHARGRLGGGRERSADRAER
jgi:hypothetical protein